MGKEVVKKQEQQVALPSELADWGDTGVNVGNDILLPKLLVMQAPSDLVTEGRAVMGEFRNSITAERLGSINEPIEIIPFHVIKSLDILRRGDDGQFLWARTEPLIENVTDPAYNDNLPWEGQDEDGTPIKRVRRLNFFVLLVKDVVEGTAIPYTLSFKSTSMKEGRKMFNRMYVENKMRKLPPAAFTFQLGGIREKNDKGTFIIQQPQLGRQVTIDELKTAKQWYDQVVKGAVKYDLTDDEGTTPNETTVDTGEY